VASNIVGDVLDHHPNALKIFLAFGFRPLSNPLLRQTLARRTTIAQACRMLGVDASQLLDALNAEQKPRAAGGRALPVIPAISGTACDSAHGAHATEELGGGTSSRLCE
jgi:hypothetical protein